MTQEPIVKACKLTDNIIAVEVYYWRDDNTVDWLPSLHHNLVDFTFIAEQIADAEQVTADDNPLA